jgi:hypothetical protein
MKMIFIYGPPAAGKLTVANELAAATGFKLFHNHLSIDCVAPVFDFGTRPFARLVEMIRLAVFEEAARSGLDGLISTFVYARDQDDASVSKMFGAVERQGGEICPVRLYCEKEELEERLAADSRKSYRKLTSVETLRELLKHYDLFSPIPTRESLSLDTTRLAPAEAARRIISHYKLPAAS